jgi:hypothetical protein
MKEMTHFIGKKDNDGTMGRFFGSLDEEEFEALMEKLDGQLPKGFVAWHISNEEIRTGSKRIDLLKKLPLYMEFNCFVHSGEVYADIEKALIKAKKNEIEENSSQSKA